MEIGAKIKELRLERGLTQEELGDRCELTKGYISQLENDLTSPSIATLKDILVSLGSSLSEFFSDEEADALTFGEDDYFEKETDESVIRWLVPASQKNAMEPIMMTLKPGCKSNRDLPHEGEEFGYVIKGRIKVTVGKRTEACAAGGSFYFRSGKMHYIENAGADEAVILWISCPPNF